MIVKNRIFIVEISFKMPEEYDFNIVKYLVKADSEAEAIKIMGEYFPDSKMYAMPIDDLLFLNKKYCIGKYERI